jgi:hypothetical protein
MTNYAKIFKSIDKCRETAYNANNEWFKDYWHKVADDLEAKYVFGQPWLRTYDGKLN